MFFTDMETWTGKKLRMMWLIFSIAYLLASLVAPIIIVGCRYAIFEHVSKYKLTGWGMVLAIFVFIVGIRKFNRVVNKLPETTHKQQVLKYTIQGIKAIIIPIFALIVMHLMKTNFDLAYSTLWWCLMCYSVAIFIDYTCIKYLDREIDLRNIAKEKIEVDKRVDLMKG